MKKLKFFAAAVTAAIILLTMSAPDARSQTWHDFVHPDHPHDFFGSPSVPLNVPGLTLGTGNATVTRPLLVVLMEWVDMTHRPVHDLTFWHDLVFGNPRPGNRPSVYEIYYENSNGRMILTPATAGDLYDGSQDGVISWTASDSSYLTLLDPPRKRAEGIRVADPLFDYWRYDSNGDGQITTDELIVLVVFADNAPSGACRDQHDPTLGHPDPPNTVGCPGGNTRLTDPAHVSVDAGPHSCQVFQFVAGVGEIAHVEVVAHEIGHASFGHADLYPIDPGACHPYTQTSTGYICNTTWYPPDPGSFSIMASYFVDYKMHFDPWAKMHYGFTLPKIITHDGTYSLYDAETVRSYTTQSTQPEVLIIFDPLRSNPYQEYFILENRNNPRMWDQGMTVWLIDETLLPTDVRRVDRLIRRSDHWAHDSSSCWDGTSPTSGYDFTEISNPRDTEWTNGDSSYIEITDISAAGTAMSMHIRMTPIFVDYSNSGTENGTLNQPYNTIAEALIAIPEPPRTIRIRGGHYPGSYTINTPCTLMKWRSGNAVIGQ
jgi:M6 family metalloprotease-like protein